MKIWRQGDVLIKQVGSLPKTTQKRENGILAYGEVTGHCHQVDNKVAAEVLEVENGLYLRVGEEGVRIIHDEHSPITLPPGNFEITIQRSYQAGMIQNVAD
jgi:hypothetical protein